jgi:methenyltetrahydrofolate cyclohydrolase
MKTFVEHTANELLDRLASSDPTPGGGSAAALAGATAAALVAMVAGMTRTRSGSEDDRRVLAEALAHATEEGTRLRALIDEDARAYDAVIAARRLPKETDAEKDRRRQAVSAALVQAAEVPMRTAEACLRVLRSAEIAAVHGNLNARSDAVTAAALAWAGLAGALENVRVNLEGESGGPLSEKVTELTAAGQQVLRALGLLTGDVGR